MVAQMQQQPQLPIDTILHGDSLEVLRSLPDACVDAIVTDPPAGISFMSRKWDSDHGGRDNWIRAFAAIYCEALRVLKPGGHALVWALPRTSHWTAMALEDAGFEVRDCCTHLFGAGFPKSLNVSKAIDKAAKAPRVITRKGQRKDAKYAGKFDNATSGLRERRDKPATDAARTWDGWGTALKPAAEFWWLCRKPLSEPTVAANVLMWGTGALNIDGSRVESGRDNHDLTVTQGVNTARTSWAVADAPRTFAPSTGRWPANLLLSHSLWCDETACALDCPVRALDAQSGIRTSTGGTGPASKRKTQLHGWTPSNTGGFGDTGGASRYFTTFRYTAKASRRERGEGNHHPTVKSLALMSWLITLITPPGGLVLDPFAGSGSTLVAAKEGGWRYLGIEREAEYVAIAQARLEAALSTVKPAPAKPKRTRTKKQPQPTLLEVSA